MTNARTTSSAAPPSGYATASLPAVPDGVVLGSHSSLDSDYVFASDLPGQYSTAATSAAYGTDAQSATGSVALTPDAMIIYLELRLGGIDSEINAAFAKQKSSEAKRKDLMAMQSAAGLGAEGGTISKDQLQVIKESLEHLKEIDPTMGQKLHDDLIAAGVDPYADKDIELDDNQAAAFGDCIGNRLKDIGASAELDMIQLQALMGQRQTAISLATNLCATIGKGIQAIADNCRS